MDRATFKLIMAIGVLINGPLYLAAVLFLAVVLGDPWTAKFAIAGIGVTYLSYVAQFVADFDDHRVTPWASVIAPVLVWLSIAIGVIAGLLLLVG